jgi:hypothetical protein
MREDRAAHRGHNSTDAPVAERQVQDLLADEACRSHQQKLHVIPFRYQDCSGTPPRRCGVLPSAKRRMGHPAADPGRRPAGPSCCRHSAPQPPSVALVPGGRPPPFNAPERAHGW